MLGPTANAEDNVRTAALLPMNPDNIMNQDDLQNRVVKTNLTQIALILNVDITNEI